MWRQKYVQGIFVFLNLKRCSQWIRKGFRNLAAIFSQVMGTEALQAGSPSRWVLCWVMLVTAAVWRGPSLSGLQKGHRHRVQVRALQLDAGANTQPVNLLVLLSWENYLISLIHSFLIYKIVLRIVPTHHKVIKWGWNEMVGTTKHTVSTQ